MRKWDPRIYFRHFFVKKPDADDFTDLDICKFVEGELGSRPSFVNAF